MARWFGLGLLAACHRPPASLVDLDVSPCDDDRAFWCGALERPFDPSTSGGSTFDFEFALRPADGESQGTLVIVDGGPGVAGRAAIDDLTYLDPALSETFDLVYLNLRGTGDAGFYCRDAVDAWTKAPLHVDDEAEEAALLAAASAFSDACIPESGWPESDAAWLRTDAGITDLAALADAADLGPLTLYGLSYGTQFVQEFVTAYPDDVRAVVLDGVVDLTLRDIDYATELVTATNTTLDGAFAACAALPSCLAADLPGAFDLVAAQLDAGAVSVESPMTDGTFRARSFSRHDLDITALSALDDPYGRAHFLRAVLAASERGDYVPLRRLADDAIGFDPYTERYETEDYSDAVYYDVTCNDYGPVDGGAEAWMARGRDATGLRLNSAYYTDLPCLTWPTAGEERPRPGPFLPDVPVLVVNASADVATPAGMGERVFERLLDAQKDVSVIHVDGGHHVTWGDNTCADPVVNAFLLDPTSAPDEVTCDGGWLAGWQPLGPTSTADLAVDAALDAFVVELFALPWFPWMSVDPCDGGGTVTVDDDFGVRIEGCRFFDDLVVDGSGTVDPETYAYELSLRLSGAHDGRHDVTGIGVDPAP
jgi:pimeloyl-ACP methyl ester carboxylesterase